MLPVLRPQVTDAVESIKDALAPRLPLIQRQGQVQKQAHIPQYRLQFAIYCADVTGLEMKDITPAPEESIRCRFDQDQLFCLRVLKWDKVFACLMIPVRTRRETLPGTAIFPHAAFTLVIKPQAHLLPLELSRNGGFDLEPGAAPKLAPSRSNLYLPPSSRFRLSIRNGLKVVDITNLYRCFGRINLLLLTGDQLLDPLNVYLLVLHLLHLYRGGCARLHPPEFVFANIKKQSLGVNINVQALAKSGTYIAVVSRLSPPETNM